MSDSDVRREYPSQLDAGRAFTSFLKKGYSKNGQAGGQAKRKAAGCEIKVAGHTAQGLREERTFTACRDPLQMRFQIFYTADGGAFGRRCFRLQVSDSVSGAKADNLGNICTLEPFTIISKGCRYKCEFVKFIAAAGEKGEEEGEEEDFNDFNDFSAQQERPGGLCAPPSRHRRGRHGRQEPVRCRDCPNLAPIQRLTLACACRTRTCAGSTRRSSTRGARSGPRSSSPWRRAWAWTWTRTPS